jgi:phosphatidylserine/phosphatidylglycerophosphate/cardiolipin synthase-like enzyme
MNDLHHIAGAATQLTNRLPHWVLVSLAEAVDQHGGEEWPGAKTAILHHLPTLEFRDAAADFLQQWQMKANGMTPHAVATALVTAARSELARRQEEIVEIVWTGPETADTRFRQTEQAILELVNSAKRRLTVISYAVYRIPRIQDALVAAARRGVSIRLIVETPSRVEGQSEYDCLMALGKAVASVASVYYWPQENRAKDDNGKIGILHVKCAVADAHRLFLSSANFTDYAFTINMELGLLVTGGKRPGEIERHFEKLIEAGQLVIV